MNNFYTFLIIPEKNMQVRKIVVPAVYIRMSFLLGMVGSFFVAFMVYDYINVMRHLGENKRLQTENRQLKQQMQTFTTKLQNVHDALERIQTYSNKLRIITNQGGENTETLKKRVTPDLPGVPMDDQSDTPANKESDTKHSGGSSTGANPLSPYLNLGELASLLKKNQAPMITFSASLTPVPYFNETPMDDDSKYSQTPGNANAPTEDDKTIRQKKISDLIKEEDEKESQELREDFDKLHLAFDAVLQHALAVELDVQNLESNLIDQRDKLDSLPTLRPTPGGWFTSGFGVRNSPYTGKGTMHEGLDIANNIGSPIYAPAAGVVAYAGPKPGYGNLVTVEHGYGFQTQYGHLSKMHVRVGDKVKRGQVIANVGSTGRSTGPHLHYEVRVYGVPWDPIYFILED